MVVSESPAKAPSGAKQEVWLPAITDLCSWLPENTLGINQLVFATGLYTSKLWILAVVSRLRNV